MELGVGVLTTDRNFVVRTWNQWLASATGLREDSARGRTLEELTGGPASTWYSELFTEVFVNGTPRVLAPAFHRYLVPCPPRTPSIHFDRMQQRVTVAPLRDGMEIVGLIVTIEDVTQRLDAERALAAEAQARTTAAGGPLAAVGADDWRLRRAAVQSLRQTVSPADIGQLIESIQRDHHNFSVLSSALQVLMSADLDVEAPLIGLLADPDPNLRMHAALALGQLHSEAAVPGLIAALDDADANVRFHAIEALGRLGVPDAVERLTEIAASGDFFLAFGALEALGKTDDPTVAPRLVGLLGLDDVRPAVVDTLAAIGDEECVLPLVELLNAATGDAAAIAGALERIHRRYEETYAAGAHIADLVHMATQRAGVAHLAEALDRRATPLAPLVVVLGWVGAEAVDPLVRALGEQEIQASVDAALLAIGREAVDPIIDRVGSGSRQERLAAAALAGRLGDRRAVPVLTSMLSSADGDLVAAAAGALAQLGDPRAFEPLLPLFAHESVSVRQAAIAAVNSIAAPATADRVRPLIADANPRARESAVRVAGYFGFEECAGAIIAAARDEHDEVRRAVIEQLPVLDHPEATPTLLRALTGDTPRNRAAAAHALRGSDDLRTIAPLRVALDDPDAWVRYFAAAAAGSRRLAAAIPDLRRLATGDRATHVRIAAVTALGALNAPEVVEIAGELLRHPDADLVAAALSALTNVRDARADELLREVVHSALPAARVAAVQALAARPGPLAADALAWAARLDDPPTLRSVAIEGLARLAAMETPHAGLAVKALLDLAAEAAAQDASLDALAALPATAAPAIGAALAPATRLGVRLAAVDALGRMRHRRASDELARGLADADPAVRSRTIAAFGRLGTPGIGAAIAELRTSDSDAGVRRRADAACRRHGWSTERRA